MIEEVVMPKRLSEMSLEELWELFPIFLEEHKTQWKQWFQEEKLRLEKILPQPAIISHIGSTAIPGIWAKPIVDIMAEISDDTDMNTIKQILSEAGYTLMSEEKSRMSFNKGYTENGFAERVFHLHLRYAGDNDELYFRDYLIDNRDIAKEYEKLKLGLWKQFEHDRDGYTQSKTEFVKKYTAIAKGKEK